MEKRTKCTKIKEDTLSPTTLPPKPFHQDKSLAPAQPEAMNGHHDR